MTPGRVAIVAGGHLACTVLQPCSPAVFTTANLGGIKVSPLELERIVNGHTAVYESAAVAVQPDGKGPKDWWSSSFLMRSAALQTTGSTSMRQYRMSTLMQLNRSSRPWSLADSIHCSKSSGSSSWTSCRIPLQAS